MSKVYVEVLSIGDEADTKLLFPREMAQALGLSNRQMTRRFVDTIAKSRRFEVYDIGSSVTAEQSDFVIDGIVTSATQELVPSEGGARVSMTRVRLSVQLKNRYSGELLFPAPVEVVGQTGRATGDRVVLTGSDRPEDPQVQRRLAVDYERALQRAFDDAAGRIEWVLRPLGRVLSADGDAVGIVGGMRHGLQTQDRLVVFRAQTTTLGGREIVARTTPIAVITCDGVGTITSQCDIARRHPQLKVEVGDYAVLTDDSLKQVRFQ